MVDLSGFSGDSPQNGWPGPQYSYGVRSTIPQCGTGCECPQWSMRTASPIHSTPRSDLSILIEPRLCVDNRDSVYPRARTDVGCNDITFELPEMEMQLNRNRLKRNTHTCKNIKIPNQMHSTILNAKVTGLRATRVRDTILRRDHAMLKYNR